MATREQIVEAIKSIIDPELFIDIWTLGLIYDIEINEDELTIRMTFTSVACPAGPQLAGEVKERTEDLDGVSNTTVEIVFDPPWQPSEELRALMGM